MERLAILALVFSISMPAYGECPVEIPLEEVWGYNLPGTHELTDAMRTEGYVSEEGPLIREIRRKLKRDPDKKSAAPSFVVEGTDMDAITAAHSILTADTKPEDSVSEGVDASVVFFSYDFGSYVQLERIERAQNTIRIVYKFVPHDSQELTQHLAIIPIGKLDVGTYNVIVEKAPIDRKLVEQGYQDIPAKQASEFVSGSFKFEVTTKP